MDCRLSADAPLPDLIFACQGILLLDEVAKPLGIQKISLDQPTLLRYLAVHQLESGQSWNVVDIPLGAEYVLRVPPSKQDVSNQVPSFWLYKRTRGSGRLRR